MREILFRGKRVDNGEWVEGYVYRFHPICRIRHWLSLLGKYGDADVYPATVGQYTGLKDKNGKRIFEGDIVVATDDLIGSPFADGLKGKVVYEETAFFIEPENVMDAQWLFNECAVYEIIGNIHENPELLEGGVKDG